MVLVYVHTITPRLEYTCKLLLEIICGLEFSFTTIKSEFDSFKGPRIFYGQNPDAEVSIPPHTLLFDSGIKQYSLKEGSSLFDDPLADAFYIASRYEEYLPYKADEHQRFEARESILFKRGLLSKPYLHQIGRKILGDILVKFPGIEPRIAKQSPEVLIDVDQAYSFKGKWLSWSAYIFLKNLVKGDFKALNLQKNVLAGRSVDPYDSYFFLKSIQENSGIDFTYFIHCGDRGKFDRTVPVNIPAVSQLVKSIASYANTGIHPSYHTGNDTSRLPMEIERLEMITGRKTVSSRQHYLRLTMPVSYRQLINAGITKDYSMGYATEAGFRAGLCVPFPWYDLEMETETNLVIYPVCFMEGIFGEEKNMDPTDAWKEMEQIIDTVNDFNGKVITAWHNHTLTDFGHWKGWKEVFNRMIQKISNR